MRRALRRAVDADEYEDVTVEVGESSLEEGVYEPVQRILDQVRAAKVLSR